MAEKPILLNGDMVRAAITCKKCGHISVPVPCEKCGSTEFVKTNTRHPIKPQPESLPFMPSHAESSGLAYRNNRWWTAKNSFIHQDSEVKSPYAVGDVLWVRENFQPLWAKGVDESNYKEKTDYKTGKGYRVNYLATDNLIEWYDVYSEKITCKQSPSIHMPRWAARIFLKVKSARVERVQEISEADAKAEGVKLGSSAMGHTFTAKEHFRGLWDSIYAKRGYGWDMNPYVFVYEFERVKNA